MKVVGIGAAIFIAISPVAVAQQGGYPASPSHGVVGAPKPDGSVRYGNEPSRDATSSPDTVGRNAPDGRGVDHPSDPANNASSETPDRAGNADKR